MLMSSLSSNFRAAAFALCLLSLTACGADPSGPAQQAAEAPIAQQTLAQRPVLSGREVYGEYCACCHDAGLHGAPVTGKPADWENRSQLWQAVLMEHAKAGYLDMPAGGGAQDLSDLAVSAAVEYMMYVTFPQQLRD